MEKELQEILEREATFNNISVAELCRMKLKVNSPIDKFSLILKELAKINSILENRGIYKYRCQSDSNKVKYN